MLKIQKTIVNKRGERLIFDDIIENDSFYLTKNNDKFGTLNSDGIEIIKPDYDEIILTKYGLFKVRQNNLYGLIDSNGTVVVPVKYTFISDNAIAGMVEMRIDKKYGFFNLSNNYIIEAIYDSVTYFEYGISRVQIEGKYGCIDKNGTEIILIEYDYISEFYANVAEITKNDKHGYITIDGKEILQPVYDEVDNDGYLYHFYFGRRGKTFTCVDEKGKFIFALDISRGIVKTGEGYQKVSHVTYEEYFKFDCGISVIKQNGIFSCISENNVPLVHFYDPDF